MKKTMIKKGLCIGLASILSAGVLPVSVFADSENQVSYPLDTDVTLTVAFIPNQNAAQAFENLEDTPFYIALQEKTGVDLEFVPVADEQALELMMMSDDMPDMIWASDNVLPGGAQICIEDGIIISLNDYLDEYMPDYKALLESDNDYKSISTTASGDVYATVHAGESFAQLQIGGIIARQDWLDDLGLEEPRTAEDFYEVLVAFKEQKGAEVPLTLTWGYMKEYFMKSGIPDAFGLITTDYYQVDGEVHYGYYESEYKDMLEFLNELYKEGLLDPEFATNDDETVKSNFLTGRSGVSSFLTGRVDAYRDAQEDENFCLRGITPLVQNEGDIPRSGISSGKDKSGRYFITSSCEHPEIAAMVLNYGYTEEGSLLYNFGTEGESWEYDEEGNPTFTELVTNNADGWSFAVACASYAHANHPGPFIQQERYYQQAMSVDEDRIKTWEEFKETDWDNYYVSSGVSVPVENTDEYAKLSSEISTYIDEMTIAYITGAKSLDTFESEYLATLKSLKIERMIEIYQTAYDEYMSVLEG